MTRSPEKLPEVANRGEGRLKGRGADQSLRVARREGGQMEQDVHGFPVRDASL